MPVTRSASRASARSGSRNSTNTQDDEGFGEEYESDYDYEYSDDDGVVEDESMADAESQGSHNKRSREDCDDSSVDADSSDVTSENPNAPRDRSSNISTANFSRFGSNAVQVMDSSELKPVMVQKLREVTDVLQIPEAAAFVLLREHRWNKERLFELFYSSGGESESGIMGEGVLKASGVLERCKGDTKMKIGTCTVADNKRIHCQICFDDDVPVSDSFAMPCGHSFCKDCWNNYIDHMISLGPNEAIHGKCPQAGCQELVTEEELDSLNCSAEIKNKYKGYQLRCFVEQNGHTRWCPGAGCNKVAYCASSLCDSVVSCDCGERFCLSCGEEPHAPAKCKVLMQWREKCKNESETANWILANTKSCPKCSSRIEKNQGCNHMNCQQCKYEFCWICMGDWAEHGANTGGYYKCNKFDPNTTDTTDAAKAKRELDRYLHYYKRYHAHSEAQKFATRQLQDTEAKMVLLQEASDNSTWIDVQFLKTATEQLIECRRVLKYTYTFAYYMHSPANTNNPNMESQKERFEHHQEMLERFTENLSELSEKPLSDMDRTDVINQTRVVDRFMKNVLKYVDEGMEE
mmetsp:Transcript_16792/g.26193  ORF Transcript_16792/g.26193 Transcript_16792/m.26193 type:complete len:577 (+) Transcript_16792:125-1855(+)